MWSTWLVLYTGVGEAPESLIRVSELYESLPRIGLA
jgi:hypothetical protein